MKTRLFAFFLGLGLTLACQAQTAPAGSPVARWGALRVEKAQLVSSKTGESVALRGMSLFDTSSYGEYANADVLAWLRDDWKATVFRAAMYTNYNGKFVGEAAYKPLFGAIQAAIDTGMYILVDWHILTDGNPQLYKAQALAFFAQVATKFGQAPNVIYEICNEPNGSGVTWDAAIKPYALEVVPVIRAIDPDNVIVVGTPEWSSHPEIAAADPLPFANVMYTQHFYAGTHDHSYVDRLDQARAAGAAVFVTEWGVTNAQVSGALYFDKSRSWLADLASRNVSWANWSLGTKLEPASALKPLASTAGAWKPGDLTESGLFLRSALRGEAAGPVFADNFDSGNFKAGGWVRDAAFLDKTTVYSGIGSVRLEGQSAMKKILNADSVKGWTWSFVARGEGWKPGDQVLVEWSADGSSWKAVPVTLAPTADWKKVQGTLPGADGVSAVQWRIRSDFRQADARYWFDDVELDGTRG